MSSSILVIEDTVSLREVLCSVLETEGYTVTGVGSAEEGLTAIGGSDFTMVLSDLKLPGLSGLDFVRKSKELKRHLPVIVMTAYGSIEIAVEAMKLGAVDFVTKPFDPEMLCDLLRQISAHRRIIDRNFKTKKDHALITQSPKLDEIIRQAKKVAPLCSSVLILGESGTGKELLARLIHQHSGRFDKPFVAVNCGSLPSDLLESEFFGHEAGSFTGATERRVGLFEVATEGTIFLDEIGNMPAMLQTKLLRTLQELEIRPLGSNKVKKVDTRVVSATNCDIEARLQDRTFREDLYYRLGVVVIEIPPLRERPEDVELLANYFIKSFAKHFDAPAPSLSSSALSLLKSYDWPGNVRELENMIERAMVFSNGAELSTDMFVFDSSGEDNSARGITTNLPKLAADAAKEAERKAIHRTLVETKGNKSKAARILGVSYKTLLNKVKEYDLELGESAASH